MCAFHLRALRWLPYPLSTVLSATALVLCRSGVSGAQLLVNALLGGFMHARQPFLMAAVALGAACTDTPTPTAAARLSVISDGAHLPGNAGFYFLPPMVPAPTTSGTANATLDPKVVICVWDGLACGTILATFTTDRGTTYTTQPGNSETVRRSEDHYLVDWHTRDFELDPELTYRICVRVGDVDLGYADVDVVASGSELQEI